MTSSPFSTASLTLTCPTSSLSSLPPQSTDDWQTYFDTLPAGAKHFAFRCTSRNTYMHLLDDITYTPKGTPIQGIPTTPGKFHLRQGTRTTLQVIR